VVVNIKNTGSNSGTPGCSVNLSSSGHAYNGFATIHPDTSVKPGDVITRTAVLTVTNQGANQVTVSDSSVHCFPA
jgi:hypothetical protein